MVRNSSGIIKWSPIRTRPLAGLGPTHGGRKGLFGFKIHFHGFQMPGSVERFILLAGFIRGDALGGEAYVHTHVITDARFRNQVQKDRSARVGELDQSEPVVPYCVFFKNLAWNLEAHDIPPFVFPFQDRSCSMTTSSSDGSVACTGGVSSLPHSVESGSIPSTTTSFGSSPSSFIATIKSANPS